MLTPPTSPIVPSLAQLSQSTTATYIIILGIRRGKSSKKHTIPLRHRTKAPHSLPRDPLVKRGRDASSLAITRLTCAHSRRIAHNNDKDKSRRGIIRR